MAGKGPMRAASMWVVVGLGFWAACEKKPPVPLAGVYAVHGEALLEWPGRAERRLTARVGLTVTDELSLRVEKGTVVLEGINGAFVALGPGRHPLREVRALAARSQERRRALVVQERAEERDLPALITQSRYEPPPTGRPLPLDDDGTAGNLAYFFAPEGRPEQHPDRPTGAPPPWLVAERYLRALGRPVVAGDSGRALARAKGAVVVEFDDSSTSLASALALPLDLAGVRRVVVVDGTATLALAGGVSVELRSGDVAEVEPLPGP